MTGGVMMGLSISNPAGRFFPENMTRLPIWVLWRLEDRNGSKTKVPYQIGGRRASSTDPSSWATHPAIMEEWEVESQRYQGIGAVMSKQYRLVFIDIDHCITPDGGFDERASDILEAFMDDNGELTTFCEFSQSGTGLHLVVIGEIPRCFNNRKKGIEMYDDNRFIAMTGNALATCEPADCADGIRYVFEKYKTVSALPSEKPIRVDPATQRNDDWIIRHASARETSRFSALFNGDWSAYDSRSEADMALCCLLAFWTNNNPEAIDRIFRRSGLYREKWERENYRRPTIQKAISHNDDTLEEFTRRKIKKGGNASLEELDI